MDDDDARMDDDARTAKAVTLTRVALLVAGCFLLTLQAGETFGDRGAEAVLVLALVAVALLAYRELTGRQLPQPWRRADGEGRPTAAVDEWRSERWVRESVERGYRALEEWRREQREA